MIIFLWRRMLFCSSVLFLLLLLFFIYWHVILDLKAALNKFLEKRNSYISLIKYVSYRLPFLFCCPSKQASFISPKFYNLIVAKSEVFLFAWETHEKLRLWVIRTVRIGYSFHYLFTSILTKWGVDILYKIILLIA
jgi:hypothetical protein